MRMPAHRADPATSVNAPGGGSDLLPLTAEVFRRAGIGLGGRIAVEMTIGGSAPRR